MQTKNTLAAFATFAFWLPGFVVWLFWLAQHGVVNMVRLIGKSQSKLFKFYQQKRVKRSIEFIIGSCNRTRANK